MTILDRLVRYWYHVRPISARKFYVQIGLVWTAIQNLENSMSDAFDDQAIRGGQLVGLIKAEFASVHEQLDAALAGNGAAVDSAVAERAQADAERLKGLLDELSTVLPADVPDVPTPAPGEPAELPADGGDTGSDGGTPDGVTESTE